MIASKDRELVQDLQEAAHQVAGTFEEIKWIMDNVSSLITTLMRDMDKRIWFHDFWGLRVVSRAIAYGFVQVSVYCKGSFTCRDCDCENDDIAIAKMGIKPICDCD